jgi:hypothetical protein
VRVVEIRFGGNIAAPARPAMCCFAAAKPLLMTLLGGRLALKEKPRGKSPAAVVIRGYRSLDSLKAGGDVALAHDIRIYGFPPQRPNLNSHIDLNLLLPSYVLGQLVLEGKPSVRWEP